MVRLVRWGGSYVHTGYISGGMITFWATQPREVLKRLTYVNSSVILWWKNVAVCRNCSFTVTVNIGQDKPGSTDASGSVQRLSRTVLFFSHPLSDGIKNNISTCRWHRFFSVSPVHALNVMKPRHSRSSSSLSLCFTLDELLFHTSRCFPRCVSKVG